MEYIPQFEGMFRLNIQYMGCSLIQYKTLHIHPKNSI